MAGAILPDLDAALVAGRGGVPDRVATKMNNGWSEHHRALRVKEFDRLQKMLNDIKDMHATLRAEKTFKRVVNRLPEVAAVDLNRQGDSGESPLPQIGGA